MHVRYLLAELGVHGDVAFLATALLSPLEPVVLEQQIQRRAPAGSSGSRPGGTTWCGGWSASVPADGA